jgi:hypothetical protein
MIIFTNFSHSVEDNGDGTFDVLRGDGGQYQGTFESREDAEQAANALEDDGDQAHDRRRWTVRGGTTGTGPDLFEVYATTMEEARESVKATAEVRTDASSWDLLDAGFTVHAITRTDAGAGSLALNPYASRIPAPDLELEPATI